MSARVDVQVNRQVFDAMRRAFAGNVSQAVRAVAYSIEAKAKIKCPVDTGALRSSIMVRTFHDYGGLVPAAGRPTAKRQELPQPPDSATAYVGPTMEYGVYVELGTHRRSARPYLTPAVRETEREIAEHFGDICDG